MAGFEKAVQEYEQAARAGARAGVHVAVAQTTEMCSAEMRTIMGALENQAKRIWTFHHVMSEVR